MRNKIIRDINPRLFENIPSKNPHYREISQRSRHVNQEPKETLKIITKN